MRVHERMLIGAIDSFLSTVVHVRPYLATVYREQLEQFADYWIEEGYPNELDSVDEDALAFYLATRPYPATAEKVLREFYSWAHNAGLLDTAFVVEIA